MALRDVCQGWCEDIFGSGMFESVETVLNINPSTGSYSTAWNVVESLYNNVCMPIAMGLVLIYFMVNLIEKGTQQQGFDMEHLFKLLLKLFVGLYFIEHGLEIMCSIYSLSFAFLQKITAVAGGDGPADMAKTMWTQLTGESWDGEWKGLKAVLNFCGVGLQLLIPWIASLILKVIVNFVCFTRLIEFYIKTACAPIALSDFFTEGIHGNGWRFLKGYIAVALQAGVILLAIVFYNAIQTAFLTDSSYMGYLVKFLALGFTVAGIMLKSLSLTKEIVGAN